MQTYNYAGFWIRSLASLIDTVFIFIIIAPILTAIYGGEYWHSESLIQGGWDVLFNYILPAIVVVIFWLYKSATPGKMLTKITIVDVKTAEKPSSKQFLLRYFAYYISMLPLFLGFFWIALDKKKQGWHDKIAGTLVIKNAADQPSDEGNIT